MGKKLTQEEFEKKVHEKSPNIEILGRYLNNSTKIKCRCKLDDYEWLPIPKELMKGHGCPKCAGVAKLTQEEFENAVRGINPNIKILGKYSGNKNKIECECLRDGYKWCVVPSSLLRGHGCPVCSGLKKYTHEEFVAKLKLINPSIIVVGRYINSSTKIECKCAKDEYIWSATPANLLSGHGCPKCAKKNKCADDNDFKKKLKKISPNIIVESSYVNNTTKVDCRCSVCNNKWTTSPSVLLRGVGCIVCANRINGENARMSEEEFLNKVHFNNPNIKILSKYRGRSNEVDCECTKDGYKWTVKAANLLNGYGCPKCSGRKVYTQEEFEEKVNSISPTIKIIGKYKNNKTKIDCVCLVDGHKWNPIAGQLVKGIGCPRCNISHGEKAVSIFLKENNIKFEQWYKFDNCRNKNPLPFDFYLPDYNTCIEYDGEYHYKAIGFFGGEEKLKNTQERDAIKTKYCEDNNIKLVRIPYWDFDNINNILRDHLLAER